ncbi:MAG: type ISP restriction/modification enzyme, partial [Spirulinaceae cyanobacterium]
CIVLASRSRNPQTATVKFRALPEGLRTVKFSALAQINLTDADWLDCPTESRAPFLPGAAGAWATYPALANLFNYNGSGVMPGRTWIIAPDRESLEQRWQVLINAPVDKKEELFHPHGAGDRTVTKVLKDSLPGQPHRAVSIAKDSGQIVTPVGYACRSFDRQWIIPDKRLINRPNPNLWEIHSQSQLYLTALSRTSPSSGCALTLTHLIPDLDHYNGRGGRVFPLWADAEATIPNLKPALLDFLSQTYGHPVSPTAAFAYIAAVAANPAYTERFQDDLTTPGLRIPLSADPALFQAAVELGQRVVWLQTFGERMADPAQDRPPGAPRLPREQRPLIPKDGTIPSDPEQMPDTIDYDPATRRLLVGDGYIENVPAAVWQYEVSGKQTLVHWFSYRKKERDRPIIGNRRPPSALNQLYPDHWLDEYTTELINLLNVLGLLVQLEPQQAELLAQICEGETLAVQTLNEANALAKNTLKSPKKSDPSKPSLPGLENF